MRIRGFSIMIIFLHVAGLAVLAYFLWQGWEYYLTPVVERPHLPDHVRLKPGGFVGHGLGILGSSMIILLFIYSLRKRRMFGLRFGNMRRWLDIHILFGFLGPLFITLHTAGKFHGLVSVSYFSMIAVMLSGFLGRYIYMQIPRDESGQVLSQAQIDSQIDEMNQQISNIRGIDQELLESINATLQPGLTHAPTGLSALFYILWSDLTRPVRHRRLRKRLVRYLPHAPGRVFEGLLRLARRRTALVRRRTLLNTVNSMFHLWHVIHKPFAIVMIIIMLVHVTIVVLMGYKWVL